MRIGYPCLNWGLKARPNRTFRLASYSDERFRDTVRGNLAATADILRWNAARGLGYFRISSELIPFASHEICTVAWAAEFGSAIAELGKLARDAQMRITMHPDQFVLINALEERIVTSSIADLAWHAALLDGMGLDSTARIQIHVGGVYGDKEASRERFVRRFELLPPAISRRLAIENDDRHYTLADCLWIHQRTGVPVLFDVFHHSLNNQGESLVEALKAASASWKDPAGRLLLDYSSQAQGKREGTHADTLDEDDFTHFLQTSRPFEFDVMLEIRDKETSALRALSLATTDPRLESRPRT